jgi:hypothetical protein
MSVVSWAVAFARGGSHEVADLGAYDATREYLEALS